MSVVFNIRNQSSRLPLIMNMMRPMVLRAMQRSIHVYATHVRGRDNVTADLLSRFQVAKARAHAPYLQPRPQLLFPEWLPWRNAHLT